LNTVSLKDLLEAGVHFGHQTRRWNPKMKQYIFGERNGIYIVDLQKTHKLLGDALQAVQDLAAQGKTILFVGTKRQAQEVVAEEARRCGMPYVTERWLGGLLTNFVTIKRSLDRLRELEMYASEGRSVQMTKKEAARFEKEREKLDKNLAGIKGMKNVPDAVFVIDTRKEAIAVQEANKLRIHVFGVVDTNCDPDEVDYVIPGNDDALRAIKLFTGAVADAVLAGRAMRESRAAEAAPDKGGEEGGERRRPKSRPVSTAADKAAAAAAAPVAPGA
jgi:small subunit ribosomal protein S2